jgi:zinc D-Ala-D-Ala carboxypeptidase
VTSSNAAHAGGRRRSGALRLLLVFLALAVVAGVVLVVRYAGTSGAPNAAAAATSSAAVSTARATATTTATPTPLPPPPPAPAPAPPTFDRTQLSIDDPASAWVVVDKARPLSPIDHAPTDLVDVGGGRLMRAEAAQALRELIAAAAAEGLTLSIESAYRSYDHQVGVFRNQVARFGQAQAEVQVARPGYSEHQTGLTADIGGGGCEIETCFAGTAEGQWVAANGHRFGFLIRYPDGKREVTGFKFEPWHVRFVGVALATEMHTTGVQTMEEFFGLPAAPGYTS